ncbi:pentapeptide repeat-containing protein [Spirulina subsalsa FACHB-351]|uniref:Pentapeptide repeat-containing protein n=1 Tax=Spirulina subsalsa FACHB-351 TaxID=234711 RepID=A0ABT3L4E1_9CYAN|nr:pentapeptide repeat-containing protein [Spirulina subsalsa]MCW6036376.1 pentapeptide repeat-containing protein [Spirulina subsalsa FACHB-351]
MENNQISQRVDHAEKSQIISKMLNSMAISLSLDGTGNQVIIYPDRSLDLPKKTPPFRELGPNPYKGLLAFQETDSDRFFGRETQVAKLWEQLRTLYESDSKSRILIVYGPSGSGKSSLVRAGLIPQLVRQPLPVQGGVRIASFIPGTHPLDALANALARVATDDLSPATKSLEFLDLIQKLGKRQNEDKFTGLWKIGAILPNINTCPLIVLVDQFEEIYSQCKSAEERDLFIGNLLYAAGDRGKQVSVILTFRSDFLGELQQHPPLYRLFSAPEHGHLIHPMLPDELRRAIAKPAELAHHPFEDTLIDLLLEQIEGRENALPLLQFALKRIWEGLKVGIPAVKTLEEIGGVGGALAGEAQRLYEQLTPADQILARRIFLGLVEVGEYGTDSHYSRRRVLFSELVAQREEEERVRAIIRQFSEPSVRFLSVYSDHKNGDTTEERKRYNTIEVAHEALIRNWGQLGEWLKQHEQKLARKRRIEQLAQEWLDAGKVSGYLLKDRPLDDAKKFMATCDSETKLSSLALEFVKKSQWKQRTRLGMLLSGLFLGVFVPSIYAIHTQKLNEATQILNTAEGSCPRNPRIVGTLQYLKFASLFDRNLLTRPQSNLCYAVITNINLDGFTFIESDFQNANLQKTKLRKALLDNTKFQGAFLEEADFRDSVLTKAKLDCFNNDCSNSDNITQLSNADFRKTTLLNTSFKNAVMYNVKLDQAKLYGTDLSEVKGLTNNQLDGAELCQVTLPDYLRNDKNLDPDRDCNDAIRLMITSLKDE